MENINHIELIPWKTFTIKLIVDKYEKWCFEILNNDVRT